MTVAKLLPISVCVIAGNEAQRIRRALDSVADWAGEIIVVLNDDENDGTAQIAAASGAKVFPEPWKGHVAQKNSAADKATQPWILGLDADEEVSPALRDEIRRAMAEPGDHAAFCFPRCTHFCDRWIRHGEWYPDVKLRLFRKDLGRTEGQEPHDKVVVNGTIKQLHNAIWHYTYDDIRDHFETLNRFSTITAQQKFMQGSRFRWRDLLFRPPLRFFRGYVLRAGFLDGAHGFLIACACAYGAYMKYAKLWELSLRRQQPFKDLPEQ